MSKKKRLQSVRFYQIHSISCAQVKSSHIYLNSAFHNTDCIKAASQW